MERRNFFSVCAGAGLTVLGFSLAKSNEIEPWNVKAFAQGRLNLMKRNNDMVANSKAEITFYGIFKEEHINREFLPHSRKVILGGLIGLPVFVDDKGYCTFNSDNRRIGYVKTIDDNGILVSLQNGLGITRGTGKMKAASLSQIRLTGAL